MYPQYVPHGKPFDPQSYSSCDCIPYIYNKAFLYNIDRLILRWLKKITKQKNAFILFISLYNHDKNISR